MKRAVWVVLGVLGLLIFLFVQLLTDFRLFKGWKTFHEGTCNGLPYVIQVREIKGFSTNRIEHRFRLGRLPVVAMNVHETDWGPPYSNDIYGATPYCYTAPDAPAYRSKEEETDYPPSGRHTYTMVYLSPRKFSKSDYEQYCLFMREEWPAIDRKYAFSKYGTFPHIIGLVHARKDDITKNYEGSYKPYPTTSPNLVHKAAFRVQNDGRVEIVDHDEQDNIRYALQSLRVQMPGKRIYLGTADAGIHSLADVRIFKDKQGRTPDMDFQFLPPQ